ncbi:MAG: 5'/3'-nucleotidase SurE, partial [Bacteroidaceae bacterium]|nr:5'/3'-nucleotidase SurE [Bacteroidaceae bacterium]
AEELVEMLRQMADLVVMAPDTGRSGTGMSMTVTLPVSVRKIPDEGGLIIYSCTGTPVDCIKLAMDSFVPRRPDLIVSGINHGENAGVNVFYSGTMGAVMEGCLKNIPSIGFSSAETDPQADFSAYAGVVTGICRAVLDNGLPIGTCLNVNFPLGNAYQGIRVARQDRGQWLGEWERLTRKNGMPHFWLSGEYHSDHPDDETTDQWALRKGYVTITPIRTDLTDYQLIDSLERWLSNMNNC